MRESSPAQEQSSKLDAEVLSKRWGSSCYQAIIDIHRVSLSIGLVERSGQWRRHRRSVKDSPACVEEVCPGVGACVSVE